MYPCENCNWILFTFEVIVVVLLFLWIVSKLTAGVSKSNTCLVGKTVLITGGNSGIGYQTALALAGRGARVIIADKDDATETINKITEETNNKNVVYKYLDLGSFATIRRFAKEINEEEGRLDILINNAGMGSAAGKVSEDEIPLIMQVNYLGPFLLTHLLLEIKVGPGGPHENHISIVGGLAEPARGHRSRENDVYSSTTRSQRTPLLHLFVSALLTLYVR